MRLWPARKRPTAEERGLFQADPLPTWAQISGGYGYQARYLTTDAAVGVVAVGRAIRLLCNTIGMLPLNVYRGRGEEKRLAPDTWQYRLLNEMPSTDFTPFDLVSDLVACLETDGNAFVRKVKGPGRFPGSEEVIALIVIDPARVTVKRQDGAKVFLVRDAAGRQQTYTASDILHVRGFTKEGSDRGMSPIAQHKQKLATINAQDEFQGRYYGQGMNMGPVISIPEDISPDDAAQLETQYETHNAGLSNAHRPFILKNGATIERLSINLEESQFVESAKLGLVDVAGIYDIPATFLTGDKLSEWDFIALYTQAIQPRLRRVELALFSDPDLFPQRIIYPEFDTKPLLRTDAKTRAEVQHLQVQDGSRLVDEIRAEDGLPPLPPLPTSPEETPGKVPQMTPVGGAPNPTMGPPDAADG